ncbi:MAG: hypothetical protein ABWU16_04820 [Halothiobacillaceae bacterium]
MPKLTTASASMPLVVITISIDAAFVFEGKAKADGRGLLVRTVDERFGAY